MMRRNFLLVCALSALVCGSKAVHAADSRLVAARLAAAPNNYGTELAKPVSVLLEDESPATESGSLMPAATTTDERPTANLLQQHLQDRMQNSRSSAGDEPLSVTVREEVWSFGKANAGGVKQVDRQVQPVSHTVNDLSVESMVAENCISVGLHRAGFFGELLFLRPGNVAVPYAIEQNGAGPGASPTGPVGQVEMGFQAGFRVGVNRLSDCCSSWRGTFSFLELDDSSQLNAAAGNVLASRVVHPSTPNTSATSDAASADYDIRLQLVDVDYRHTWLASDWFQMNWLAGARYGRLEQIFIARQAITVGVGETTVRTDLEYNGGGIRLGLDGEVDMGYQVSVYGMGVANFLLGETNARFQQTNQFGGAAVIANRHEDFRITPILDLEIGVAWRSPAERWRVSAGCQTSAWLNTLTTTEYIRGVQVGQFDSLNDTLAFGGFLARIEWLR